VRGAVRPLLSGGPTPSAPDHDVRLWPKVVIGERPFSGSLPNFRPVDGDVRGNVHGKHVVITEEGSVVGMVSAETIEVRGGIRGSIRAISVKLQSTAQVEGDITHQKLAIAEGAEFDGSVHLSKDPKELMPVLHPEEIERSKNRPGPGINS
jgi:cytoskeletal protein CcmA (bactofilin family)